VIARLRVQPGLRARREAEFHTCNRWILAGLFGRAYSSSYVVHGIPDQEKPAFDAALGDLFARHQRAGLVEFAYLTQVIAFQLEEPRESAGPR